MSELCHDIFLSVGARLRQRIVFDATTSNGSSRTPMFGESGKVIGMSFAVLVDDTASNFGVGIQGAIEQLRRVGWTTPDKNGMRKVTHKHT